MIEHLDALAAHFKANLPTLKMVATHRGRFSVEELKDGQRLKPPALFVSFLRCAEFLELPSGQFDAACDWAAFIITADARGAPREVAALQLLKQVVLALPALHGDLVGRPERIAAENMWSGDLDDLALMIVALQWRQSVRIGASAFAGWHGDPAYAAEAVAEIDGVAGERPLDPAIYDAPPRLAGEVMAWLAGDIPLDDPGAPAETEVGDGA